MSGSLVDLLIKHIIIGVGNFLPRHKRFNKKRARLFRLAGMNIGIGTSVAGPISVRPDVAHLVSIGRDSFINSEVRFGCSNKTIQLGDNVLIGSRVCFETASHGLKYAENVGRGTITKAIHVGSRAWIGSGAIILSGVTIGQGAVVAAGAVVHKDVAENQVVGGVPAKFIKNTS
jgi:maltose O-acetyltransferase